MTTACHHRHDGRTAPRPHWNATESPVPRALARPAALVGRSGAEGLTLGAAASSEYRSTPGRACSSQRPAVSDPRSSAATRRRCSATRTPSASCGGEASAALGGKLATDVFLDLRVAGERKLGTVSVLRGCLPRRHHLAAGRALTPRQLPDPERRPGGRPGTGWRGPGAPRRRRGGGRGWTAGRPRALHGQRHRTISLDMAPGEQVLLALPENGQPSASQQGQR